MSREAEQITAELNKVDNLIKGQQDRQAALLHQCNECDEQISILQDKRSELLAKKDQVYDKLGSILTRDQQTLHVAQGLGDDSDRHVEPFRQHMRDAKLDDAVSDGVFGDVCGIIHAAQLQIKLQAEANSKELVERDEKITDMSSQLEHLQKQMRELSASAAPAQSSAAPRAKDKPFLCLLKSLHPQLLSYQQLLLQLSLQLNL